MGDDELTCDPPEILWCERAPDEAAEAGDAGDSHPIARGESSTVTVTPVAPTSASVSLQRIGAWLDAGPSATALDAREQVAALPDAAERLEAASHLRRRPRRGDERRDWDAHQYDLWAERLLALGLTDIVVPVNLTMRPPFRGSPFLAPDDWRRLRFMVQTLSQHRYPEGQSPRVHALCFYNLDTRFISDASAALIDLCRRIPDIASVMLDCEEWWVGGRNHPVTAAQRRQGAADVRTHLLDPWPAASRPALGIGVTGLASAPPHDLMELVDYGVPQIYGSDRNMGGAVFASAGAARRLDMVTERHHRFCERWLTDFGSRRPRVVVGHTARRRFIPDMDKLRLMIKGALRYSGHSTPALTGPEALYYWSVRQIYSSSGCSAEMARLTRLARSGGLTLANVDP